jgi:hypothetical protein
MESPPRFLIGYPRVKSEVQKFKNSMKKGNIMNDLMGAVNQSKPSISHWIRSRIPDPMNPNPICPSVVEI